MVGCCGDLGAHRNPSGCVLAHCASDVCREVGTYRILARTERPSKTLRWSKASVVLFNNPATIARLRAANHIPDGITFEAKPVAASPILTIEATADDAKAAETAAQDMAVAFRQDINAIHEAEKRQTLADLTSQLDRAQPASNNPINPMLAPPLQEQIFNTRRDTTNELQDLQLRAGVTTNRATRCGQPGPPGCGWIAARPLCRAGLSAWCRRGCGVRLTYGRRPTSNRWSRCPNLDRSCGIGCANTDCGHSPTW